MIYWHRLFSDLLEGQLAETPPSLRFYGSSKVPGTTGAGALLRRSIIGAITLDFNLVNLSFTAANKGMGRVSGRQQFSPVQVAGSCSSLNIRDWSSHH